MILDIALASTATFSVCLWTRNRQLERQNTQLQTCSIYGILTRQGLDTRWSRLQLHWSKLSVIFCDLDQMHQLNEQLGYEQVNCRIRRSLSKLRASEVAGRWFSGDEIVIICPTHEAEQAANRIAAELRANGLSGTFGIVESRSSVLVDSVTIAADLVQQAKQRNDRGAIVKETI